MRWKKQLWASRFNDTGEWKTILRQKLAGHKQNVIACRRLSELVKILGKSTNIRLIRSSGIVIAAFRNIRGHFQMFSVTKFRRNSKTNSLNVNSIFSTFCFGPSLTDPDSDWWCYNNDAEESLSNFQVSQVLYSLVLVFESTVWEMSLVGPGGRRTAAQLRL